MWQTESLLQYVVCTTHFFHLVFQFAPNFISVFFCVPYTCSVITSYNVLVLGSYLRTFFLHKNCHSTLPFREAQRYVFNIVICWALQSSAPRSCVDSTRRSMRCIVWKQLNAIPCILVITEVHARTQARTHTHIHTNAVLSVLFQVSAIKGAMLVLHELYCSAAHTSIARYVLQL